jgi:hypothetical protein
MEPFSASSQCDAFDARDLIDILIAATGEIHNNDLAFFERRRQLDDFRNGMSTLQRGNDSFFS